jgi:hypothetical protein
MLYIKITLQILAVLGLIFALGEMLNFFTDKDRIDFVKIIKEKLECPKDHPGAMKFIRDFVLKNPKYKNIDVKIEEVEKIIYVGTWSGTSNKEKGRRVDQIMSGSLKLRSNHGESTESLCSFEELRDWSKEAPFWKWLGWSMVAVSVLLGIVLFIIEEIIKRQT